MASKLGVLILLVSAQPTAARADVAPMPGSAEWEMDMREQAKRCERGEQMIECFSGNPLEPASRSNCGRLISDPDSYFLSALKRTARYCKSAPDLPQACLGEDAEVRCETACGYAGKFPFARKCASGLASCDSFLNNDKFYRIRKKDGSRLFYCGPDRKRAAAMRRLSEQWGKALEDCARNDSQSRPEAIRCGAGETERYCQDTSVPDEPESCAPFLDNRGYYELPKARGSNVPGSPVKHVYCELSAEEAAKREAGYQECVNAALQRRRQATRSQP
jgi:hypothetical protein